ncbi:hypothetical protein [Prevotella intermedia]|uniref:hypothetical protein n=1 Tax=Prevotella intermedia TaxID=28131 RepID=UPI0012FD1D29|nr:hypothetical protein [Prevotella intermedia]
MAKYQEMGRKNIAHHTDIGGGQHISLDFVVRNPFSSSIQPVCGAATVWHSSHFRLRNRKRCRIGFSAEAIVRNVYRYCFNLKLATI